MSQAVNTITESVEIENKELLRRCANTIRGLAMDAVQKAKSGHPGMPMGMADAAVVLWLRHMKHNPADIGWPDRDRFVLSAGHGSMLLYSLMHLTGYDMPLEDLKNFRQWNSKTPGHPEDFLTPGVETTTGPLGQGISNAVGMALAERHLAAQYNRPEFEVVDHYTYVIASDGDMMEGISHESCSLAGHLGLGRLTVLYDDNGITIDGETHLSFSEDVLKRFEAYGWHTQRVDGHDMDAVDAALREAKSVTDKPSIIACVTTIGFGSPNKAGTAQAHGEPLGDDEVALAKEKLGLPAEHFFVPDDVLDYMRESVERGSTWQAKWETLLGRYEEKYPDAAGALRTALGGDLPDGWDRDMPTFPLDKSIATRAASGKVLDTLVPRIPSLLGGSADLTPSNKTQPKESMYVRREDYGARYIHFGVREHGMGAMMTGMIQHGGIRPYGGTFLIFSDYMRPSIRLAALMKKKVIYVFTHDSIGLGEDGPTHQPVEHLAALRAIINLAVVRPADATETIEAWKVALNGWNGPVALALTRQNLPVLDRSRYAPAEGLRRGAYVLADVDRPDVILIGSGSELHLALEAQRVLSQEGVSVRVVSMPSWELFEAQSDDYKESVLPHAVTARVAVEAAVAQGWERYVGDDGAIVALSRYGASAPYERIYEELGITSKSVVQAARRLLNG